MAKACQLQIRRLGGSVVLIGIILSLVVHPWGIGLSIFREATAAGVPADRRRR
jgi:hypothetical protein